MSHLINPDIVVAPNVLCHISLRQGFAKVMQNIRPPYAQRMACSSHQCILVFTYMI